MSLQDAHREIFTAVKDNNFRRLKELIDVGVDVNIRNEHGDTTPLIVAAANGAKHCMEFLLARGADVNAKNDRGITALHNLVDNRYDTYAVWLVMQGADLHAKDKRGFSARDLAHGHMHQDLDGVYCVFALSVWR